MQQKITSMACFTPAQRALVRAAAARAEEIVGEGLGITAFDAAYPYDVRVLAEQEAAERPAGGTLARLVCYERPSPPYRGRSRGRFFRVSLADGAILARVAEDPEVDLERLLLYLLVHELVHVVRLARHECHWDPPPEARAAEERRVHGLSARLLAPVPGMSAVVARYRDHRLD